MKINKGTGACLTIIGRLKEVPTLQATSTGMPVTNIVLAVDEVSYKDGKEAPVCTQWIPITVWGVAATFLSGSARPGLRLYVEANVKIEKESAQDTEDKPHAFYIPVFHTHDVSVIDALRNPSSTQAEAE